MKRGKIQGQRNKKIKNDLVDDGILDPKNQKLFLSVWLDGDIVDELKRRAKLGECNGKYQTLMNQALRDVLFSEEKVPRLKKKADFFDKIKKLLDEAA